MLLDQLSPDDREALVRGVAVSAYYLLLGSGGSATAIGGDGQDLPTGAELTKQLVTAFGVDTAGVREPSLPLVHDHIIREELTCGGETLGEYYHRRFTRCTPDWQGTLFKLNWQRIFTLNIDDVLEVAAKSARVAYRWYAGRDRFEDPPQVDRPLQIVHIHGAASLLMDDDGNANNFYDASMVFGKMEYYLASSQPGTWHRIFFDTFADQPYIMLGASLVDEADLAPLLEYSLTSRFPKIAVVNSPPPSMYRSAIERANIRLIVGDAGEFIEELEAEVSLLRESLVIDGQGIVPAEARIFLQQVEQLGEQATERRWGVDHDFYGGAEPVWSDIVEELDADFDLQATLFNSIRENSDKQTVHCLVGAPGAGKSTALLRTGKMLRDRGLDVFELRRDAGFSPDAAYWWFLNQPRSVLLVDGMADFAAEIESLMDLCHGSGIPAIVVGTERPSRRARVRGISPRYLVMDGHGLSFRPLSDGEIRRVLEKLRIHGRQRRLSVERPSDQFDYFAVTARRQLFEGMAGLTLGKNFRDRYLRDFVRLDDQSRDLIALASLAHATGYPAPAGVVRRVLGVSASDLLAMVDSSAGDFLVLDSRGIRPIHRLLAAHLANSLDPEHLAELLVGMLRALGDHVNPTSIRRRDVNYLIASGLMQRRYLTRQLGTRERARSVYVDVLPTYRWNARYWDQRALLEADDDNLELAHDYAWEAVGRQDHVYSRTTLGVIMMKIAVSRMDLEVFWDALDHLRIGRAAPPTESDDPSLHPLTAFFVHSARLARAVKESLSADERERFITEWQAWLDEARVRPQFQAGVGDRQLRDWQAEWLAIWAVEPDPD